MLQIPTNDKIVYEVILYNRVVRALVKDNLSHELYDDYWADVQAYDVMAVDELEARQLISLRYPPDQGFVVEQVKILAN
ncbi:MAG: hypothetical protein HQ503_11115 [Rhodospirillales bacterium]|nr:hypothetical protein [Rhodospirillales bacterium]